MDNNRYNHSFFAKLQKWLGGRMGKMMGGGKNALKFQMPHHALKRKTLRHEPLEDRHLLAVDMGLGSAWVTPFEDFTTPDCTGDTNTSSSYVLATSSDTCDIESTSSSLTTSLTTSIVISPQIDSPQIDANRINSVHG